MKSLRGLYVITPEYSGAALTLAAKDGGQTGAGAATPSLAHQVELAIAGGARVIQYRDKSGDRERRLSEARALCAICRRVGVPLIVNDDAILAAAVAADGVHLGRDDASPAEARRLLGPTAIIGISCYDRLDLAEAAQAAGADYVAFGSFFPSSTKPLAVRADPELLRRARRCVDLPLVAIGGITPENGPALIAAGADLLAVVSGVFGRPDPRAAARAYARLFDPPDP